jgi:transcriptional repressor NrdR
MTGAEMRCSHCGAIESKVVDSRSSEDGESIRRRRECLSCGYRFTTYEKESVAALVVIKNSKGSEAFDRDKLLRGLLVACAKRDVPPALLNTIIDDVEAGLRASGRHEVNSKVLGDMVLERLRDIDDVAYIRFASVYKDFKDIEEFQLALKGMS